MIHSTWARWLVRFTTYYLLHSTTFTTLTCFCFVSIKFFSKNDHLETLQLQGGGGGGGGGWGVDKVGREPGGQHRGDWLTYGPTRPAGQHRPAVRPSAALCFIWEVLTYLHCNHWQYLPHRRDLLHLITTKLSQTVPQFWFSANMSNFLSFQPNILRDCAFLWGRWSNLW